MVSPIFRLWYLVRQQETPETLSWCPVIVSPEGVLSTAAKIFNLTRHSQQYLWIMTKYCVTLPRTIRMSSVIGVLFSPLMTYAIQVQRTVI